MSDQQTIAFSIVVLLFVVCAIAFAFCCYMVLSRLRAVKNRAWERREAEASLSAKKEEPDELELALRTLKAEEEAYVILRSIMDGARSGHPFGPGEPWELMCKMSLKMLEHARFFNRLESAVGSREITQRLLTERRRTLQRRPKTWSVN